MSETPARSDVESLRVFLDAAATGGSCPECGYSWATPLGDVHVLISTSPARFMDLIRGREATGKPDPQTWSPAGYIWHLADALRLWGERVWTLANEPPLRIVDFDPDAVAEAHGTDRLPPMTGLWSLERSVELWDVALEGADLELSFDHPDFGTWTVEDVIRWIGHEVHHHDLDVRRGLGLV